MKSAYQWAKYEDGTLIEIGDWVDDYDGVPQQVRKIVLTEKEARIYLKPRGGVLTSDRDNKVKKSEDIDTQDRIDADADKLYVDYWNCGDNWSYCTSENCSATIEGMMPKERCGCTSCSTAMILDLLYRQRLLDKEKNEKELSDMEERFQALIRKEKAS